MDISGDDPGALQEDKRDLFSAVNELGGLKDEYDAAVDDVRPRFKRGDAWREAMRAIRKCGACFSTWCSRIITLSRR